MANLELSILIYAHQTLSVSECHVAIAVAEDDERYYLYHAIEDTLTENEMMFDRTFRTVDFTRTARRHQLLPMETRIAKSDFDKLDGALKSTPVPRPRGGDWTCQNWLGQALEGMENEGFLKRGEAQCYYANMMQIVKDTALPRPRKK